MKKDNTSFFAKIFGAKGTQATAQKTTRVVLTTSSQPHVLKQRMQEEHMTHGETVLANLSPVRLEKNIWNEAVLYFCPMKKIEVLQVSAAGDGGSLPTEAVLDGFSVPKEYRSGFYRICHVELTSNGTMQVKATHQTTWEFIEDAVY